MFLKNPAAIMRSGGSEVFLNPYNFYKRYPLSINIFLLRYFYKPRYN